MPNPTTSYEVERQPKHKDFWVRICPCTDFIDAEYVKESHWDIFDERTRIIKIVNGTREVMEAQDE